MLTIKPVDGAVPVVSEGEWSPTYGAVSPDGPEHFPVIAEKLHRMHSEEGETGFAEYAQTSGNRGAWMLRRDSGDRTEFLTLSLWDSVDAIRAFAGDDIEAAVLYPEDARYLVGGESTVTHYQVGSLVTRAAGPWLELSGVLAGGTAPSWSQAWARCRPRTGAAAGAVAAWSPGGYNWRHGAQPDGRLEATSSCERGEMVEAGSRRLDAVRRADPLLVALGLLTLVTGLVDAACYLGLGRVFTANMTGNVVLLAFGAAGTQGLPVLGPTVSLVVFLVGAAGGGRLAARLVGPANTAVSASARQRWLSITLLVELGLVITAGVVAIGLPVDGGGGRPYAVIAVLAAALGLQNATVRRLAVPDLTTTVLTLTLTGLAADFGLAGRSPRVGRRLAAVGLMAAGALIGALLLRVDVAVPVLAAAVVIALAAVALRFGRSRETT